MPVAERQGTEYRCGACHRVLFEYVNEIRLGSATVVKRCDRCKKENVVELRRT